MNEVKEPCSLLITTKPNEGWNVWVSLPDHDPLLDVYGFIIGCGATRDEAVANAVKVLENATERLQAPQGNIEERVIE